jgi:hypothetical protein
MDDREIFEDDEEEVPPPALLDHLIDELIEYKAERDEDLEAEWLPEEGLFHVTRGEEEPVDVLLVEIDADFYGESEAVVVEAEIGPLRKESGLAELLRFSDEELVYGRFALASDEEGTEILVLQAATPVHQVTASQLDGMIREVAELSHELREEPPSGAA